MHSNYYKPVMARSGKKVFRKCFDAPPSIISTMHVDLSVLISNMADQLTEEQIAEFKEGMFHLVRTNNAPQPSHCSTRMVMVPSQLRSWELSCDRWVRTPPRLSSRI
jgi:hypothetical protein